MMPFAGIADKAPKGCQRRAAHPVVILKSFTTAEGLTGQDIPKYANLSKAPPAGAYGKRGKPLTPGSRAARATAVAGRRTRRRQTGE